MPAAQIIPRKESSKALFHEFARLLLVGTALLGVALAALVVWRGDNLAREQIAARLSSAAAMDARELDAFMLAHTTAIQMLAERYSSVDDLKDPAARSRELLRIRKHFPAFASVWVTDQTGLLRSSTPLIPGAARHLGSRDYFKEPKRSGRPYVTGIFRGRWRGKPTLVVSAPLFTNGRFSGVVVGSIHTDTSSLPINWTTCGDMQFLLLDQKLAVVDSSPGLPYRPTDVLGGVGRDAALRELALTSGHNQVRHIRGVLRGAVDAYGMARPLAGGWTLLVMQSEAVASANVRHQILTALGILLLVLSVVLAIALIKLRELRAKTHSLLERMQRLALKGTAVVTDDLPRELVPLAKAMNVLGSRAKAAYERVNLSLLEQSRLREDLQAVAQRLLTVQEDERRSLSRELHDDIGQTIAAIKFNAAALTEGHPAWREIVGEIIHTVDQTAVKLRHLSLLLRPPQLDSLGLESALRFQVDLLRRSSSVDIELKLEPLPMRPPEDVELAGFRIVQEALTNALRHAGAKHVHVEVELCAGTLWLKIQDDGCGFDTTQTTGLGLLIMRERAQQLGGSLSVETTPGHGTCVRASLPASA